MTDTKHTRTILYAGAPSSGRRTSLAQLAETAHAGSDVTLQWDEEPQRCRLDLRLQGPELEPSLARRCCAVVFVVDARRTRLEANDRALQSLREQLSAAGRAPQDVPLVFQLNKLDLPLDASGAQMFAQFTGTDAALPQLIRAPIATLKRLMSWPRCDYAETIASEGIGVRDALRRALELARELPLKT